MLYKTSFKISQIGGYATKPELKSWEGAEMIELWRSIGESFEHICLQVTMLLDVSIRLLLLAIQVPLRGSKRMAGAPIDIQTGSDCGETMCVGGA